MAYNEKLAERMRKQLAAQGGLVEKRMFGGVAFLLHGNMCCGVHKEALMVRLAPEATDAALRQPHTRVFDLTGRPMKGWILVEPDGLETDGQVRHWIDQAKQFVVTLPKK